MIMSTKKSNDRSIESEVKLVKKNVRLRTRVISTEASIVGAIVDYAELEGVELIVVGTRGKLGFKKLLLGSVASGVVTYSYCPVLVVK